MRLTVLSDESLSGFIND